MNRQIRREAENMGLKVIAADPHISHIFVEGGKEY